MSGLQQWAILFTVSLSACSREARPPPPAGPELDSSLAAGTTEPVSVAPPPVTAVPAEPPAPPPREDHQQADLDPENDGVVAPPEPLDDCEARLERAGIAFRPGKLPSAPRGRAFACGAEQVVTYLGGPAEIRYNGAPTLTCRMALALARFEKLAQEEAQSILGARVTRMKHVGTYSCRKMARFDWVSEHSYANAIDIQAITLSNGRRLTVEKHFGALSEPPTAPEARFLRRLANRAYDEGLFSVVLTPFWDRLHKDHLHLDLARYRVDGTRPQ